MVQLIFEVWRYLPVIETLHISCKTDPRWMPQDSGSGNSLNQAITWTDIYKFWKFQYDLVLN